MHHSITIEVYKPMSQIRFWILHSCRSLFQIFFWQTNLLARSRSYFCFWRFKTVISSPYSMLLHFVLLQIQAMRSFEYYICYYTYGTTQGRNKCHSRDVYTVFYFIIAVIPYWLRFLQVSLHSFSSFCFYFFKHSCLVSHQKHLT